MKIKKIYLDMDGVLADWCDAICELHGKDNPYSKPEAAGIWDIEDLLGMTPEQLWKPADHAFWESIPKCSTADWLVNVSVLLVKPSNVHILTSPVRKERGEEAHAACLAGKRSWIEKHFPILKDRVVFEKMKERHAEPGALLIDDKSSNVEKFIKAGGMGILVPRKWNDDHHLAQMSHKVVAERIGKLIQN